MKILGHSPLVPSATSDQQPCHDTTRVEDTDTAERVHTPHQRPTGVDAGAAAKNLARAMASAQPLDVSLDAAEALADLVRAAVLQSDDGLFRATLADFARAHATPALAPLLSMRISAVAQALVGTASSETFALRAAAIASSLGANLAESR